MILSCYRLKNNHLSFGLHIFGFYDVLGAGKGIINSNIDPSKTRKLIH